jgi:DNA mismatch repair protein MSH3
MVSVVPSIVHCRTKQVVRFRPPRVEQLLATLQQHQERLVLAAQEAWDMFQREVAERIYDEVHALSDRLATLDILLGFADLAQDPGYTRPVFSASGDAGSQGKAVHVDQARHPMVAALLQDAYVPNDIVLTDDMRLMVITGPNMGGKSSFMRMVALHLVMGQIGCYVPAARARLRVFDGIYTRMGAADEIQRGMSTFMVELLDAAQTLSAATPQSLVIMDELGRGTSTHDGYAIAYATACALVEDVCHLVHVC